MSLLSREGLSGIFVQFNKIISTGLPTYLSGLIAKSTHGYQTRTSGNIPTYHCRTDTFIYSFFPWTVTWNKIHPETRNASLTVFKKNLLKAIPPVSHSVYNTWNLKGLKLLTRLRLGLSHLNEHRFNHNFEGCINPLRTCSLEVESTSHLFFHSHYHDSIRHIMFNDLGKVDVDLPNASDKKLVNIFLYGSSLFSYNQNRSILNSSVRYIIDSNRFSESIFSMGISSIYAYVYEFYLDFFFFESVSLVLVFLFYLYPFLNKD